MARSGRLPWAILLLGPLLLVQQAASQSVSPQFRDIGTAIQQLGLEDLSIVLGLGSLLSNPDLEVVLFAPQKGAINAAFRDYPFLNEGSKAGLYHIVSKSQLPQGKLSVPAGGLSLTTWFKASPTADNSTLTIKPTSTLSALYMGGLAPGATCNADVSYVAGKSLIYLVDGLLMPPALQPLEQQRGANLAAAIRATPQVSMFSQLVAADQDMQRILSAPDAMYTVLAPTDKAMTEYLLSQVISLDSLKGSAAGKRLVQAHVLAARPYTLRSFPQGTNSFASLSAQDPITVVSDSASDPNQPTVTLAARSGASIGIESSTSAGKSELMVINGVIGVTRSTASNPPAGRPAATTAPAAVPDEGAVAGTQSDTSKAELGAIIGGVVGGVVGLLGLFALCLYCRFKHRDTDTSKTAELLPIKASAGSDIERGPRTSSHTDPNPSKLATSTSNSRRNSKRHTPSTPAAIKEDNVRDAAGQIVVHGFIFGDPFLRSTAPQYSWTSVANSSAIGVEAGLNDQSLDKLGTKSGISPVIRLTRAEVVQQIKLLNTGLLGRGASALVFKGTWPSRFGPDSLLAIKVLKDPYEADPAVFESFCYEAAVLASVRHPNVIRMYGYCLELPTACLIMELLPCTLKDKLYSRTAPNRKQSSLTIDKQGGSQNNSRLAGAATAAGAGAAGGAAAAGSAATTGAVHISVSEAGHPKTQTASDGKATEAIVKQLQAQGGAGPTGSSSSTMQSAPIPAMQDTGKTQAKDSSHLSNDPPASLASSAALTANRLTVAEVLELSADIAAGLAYLHKRPAVVALPEHPTIMLNTDPLPTIDSEQAVSHGVSGSGYDEDDEPGACHSIARIVHRDVKPSNVLLNSAGRAKISDFGLARWHNNTTVYTNHLGVGTLRYMAPELLLGHYSQSSSQTITNRVDIYSLGLILWEFVTGQLPWQEMTDAQIVAAVIAQKRPALIGPDGSNPSVVTPVDPAANALLPASLDTLPQFRNLIQACWQQRDLKRPTASAVHKEICALLALHGRPDHNL